MKIALMVDNQELNDLWSALTVWENKINKHENPHTYKSIQNLIVPVKITRNIKCAKI